MSLVSLRATILPVTASRLVSLPFDYRPRGTLGNRLQLLVAEVGFSLYNLPQHK